MKNRDEKMFFSTTEVAKILGVSRISIFNRIKNKVLKAEKIGRNYAIPREEIEHYLDGSKKITGKEKDDVEKAVDRAIKEYGEAIRMLGKE